VSELADGLLRVEIAARCAAEALDELRRVTDEITRVVDDEQPE
jgi:hypothetical protein